jgi:aminopeptidase N
MLIIIIFRSVPVDLRGAVYCSAVRKGDMAVWEFAYQRYLVSNLAAEKTKLLNALGCTREIWLLHK